MIAAMGAVMDERPSGGEAGEDVRGETRIQLCGPLRATIAGRAVEDDLPGRKGRLALAYLVVNRDRPVGRDELIGALWPEGGPATPDAALSTLLTRLRQALGTDVLRGRTYLELDLGDYVWVDIEAAAGAVIEAESALTAGRPEHALRRAQDALPVLERPFLSELDVPWVDERRRELRDLRIPLLELTARAALALPEPELAAAERAARDLVEDEPFRESGYALLMDALERSGNIAEALRVYDRLREQLRDELGVPPAREVTARAERLLRPEPPAPPPAPAPAARDEALPLPGLLAAASAQPFLGRADVLVAMREHGDEVRGRERGAVMIAGDAGIGKTRLAAELAREAHEAGWQVIYGRCDEEPLVPYQPFVEAITYYLAHAPRDAGADSAPAGEVAELGRLIPGLRNGGEESARASDADRYRLFEAVAQLLIRGMRSGPLLLVVDDLHWADKPTLLLLRHVVRATDDCPLLLVGTYRDVELGLAPDLSDLLAGLRREHLLRSVTLGGLAEEEIGALVAARTGQASSPSLVERLAGVSDGNPFVIEEVLRELSAAGGADGDTVERLGIPEGIKDLIARRLGRCREGTREALLAAAVLGREFRFDALAGVLGWSEPALMEVVEQAIKVRLVAEVPGQLDRYAFCHALTREALSEMQTARRRAHAHLRAGEALEALGAGAGSAAELAHHFHQARTVGGAARSLQWSAAAAEHAEETRAYEEAAAHYRRALEALELARPEDRSRRCELLLRLAAAHERAGEVEESRERFEQAAVLAQAEGRADALARAALGFAKWQQYGLIDHAAIGLLEDALDALGPDDDGLRARVLGLLAVRLDPESDQERRETVLAEASAMARRLGDVDALAGILRHSAFVIWQPDGIRQRLAAARESVALAGRARDAEWALWGHLNCFIELFELGEMAAADAELASYETLSDDLRHPWFAWQAPMFRATRALFDGRVDEGRRLAREALEERRRHDPGAEETYVAQMLMLTKMSGRLEGVDVATIEAFVDRYPARPVWRAMLIDLYCTLGMEDEARRTFEAVGPLPHSVDWLSAVALLCEAAAALGDAPAARRLYDLLLPYADRNAVTDRGWASWGSVSRPLGRAAAAFGDHAAAMRHLEDARVRNERMGARPWAAHAACDQAELLLADGRAPRALELISSAQEAATEAGLAGLAGRLAELRARAGR